MSGKNSATAETLEPRGFSSHLPEHTAYTAEQRNRRQDSNLYWIVGVGSAAGCLPLFIVQITLH